ncbi:hypothetical protein EON68_02540 [archaeon]|nr:MAG: hypothetical protein EON68_02540 [archaeon]
MAAVVPPRVRSGVQLTPPPLPALCAHVCNLASGPLPGAPPPSAAPGVDLMLLRPAAAQVRAWSAVYDAVDGRMTRLVLEIRGSRWCNRVQRHHKSNAVRWSIYLQPGVAVQTCWDADCIAAAYSSPPVRLPPHLLPDALHATPAAPAPPSDGLSTNTL